MKGVEVTQAMVVAMVRIVLQLTPYGILALMTKMAATSHIRGNYDITDVYFGELYSTDTRVLCTSVVASVGR